MYTADGWLCQREQCESKLTKLTLATSCCSITTWHFWVWIDMFYMLVDDAEKLVAAEIFC